VPNPTYELYELKGQEMGRTSVSVAMCTFNGAPYVGEQLESIMCQSYPPDELVICDDGSSDGTFEICRSLASKCPFQVRVVESESRLGSTKNFERAIRECHGEIVALADQDDIWGAEKLWKIMKSMQNHPDAAYVFSDGEAIDDKGRSLGRKSWDMHASNVYLRAGWKKSDQLAVLLRENVVTGSMMAFRGCYKAIFLPIPSDWVHDYWIALLGSACSYGVVIAEPLVLYRQHSAQQIGIRKQSLIDKSRESLLTQREDYQKRLHMFEELLDRVEMAGCPRESLNLIIDKVAHLSNRAISTTLSGTRRVNAVISEAWTGRYRRFSGSWRSIMRDLCPDIVRRYATRLFLG
jgi:glycosyltransferase involved in cell wall biosynthesis